MQIDPNQLKQWVEHNQILNRTIKGWWFALEKLKEEDSFTFLEYFGEDFNEKWMTVTFEKVGLYLSNWLLDENVYVSSYAIITYKGKECGKYKMVFDILGHVIDDYWLDN